MAKALFGTYATPRTIELLDEVRALRSRVAELERALADAEEARDRREDTVLDVDDPAAVHADDASPDAASTVDSVREPEPAVSS